MLNGSFSAIVGYKFIITARKGKEPFYAKLGFVERPNEEAGAGMNQWLMLEE